ncbi:MAG: site-specific integrase [Clostridia bacterium]|nr:MAG: site-specific integrase [Clostridia bacterium]
MVFQEPKTKKSRRTVPIPQDIVQELKAHKARQNQEKLLLGEAYQDNGLVFATPDGRPLEIRTFLRRFDNLLANAGVPKVRFHDLRHTYATLLLEAGEHPKVFHELLGHSNISTTLDTYSHVLPELKQAAAAKLNGILSQRKVPSQVEGN